MGRTRRDKCYDARCCHIYVWPSVFYQDRCRGFEFEVLKGLSHPIDTISIEVTPEYLENTNHCLLLLENLAEFQFQFSFGESMQFALTEWISNAEIREWLKDLPPRSFGDLYAQLKHRVTDRSEL
jgi:hypothetical protein